VPAVPLLLARARVVHRAEVDDRADAAAAEHVARLLATHVELVVLDVLRAARKRTAIDADDGRLSVQDARDESAEATADAGDEHRIVVRLAARTGLRLAARLGGPRGLLSRRRRRRSLLRCLRAESRAGATRRLLFALAVRHACDASRR